MNKISDLFNPIKRKFSDLKTHAFNALANNLTTTVSGSYALDAYQGKVLNDKLGKVLWTNPSPTSAITTLDITLSSDDYDVLDIYWKTSTTGSGMYMSSFLKGYIAGLKFIDVSGVVAERSFTRNSDVSYTLGKISTTDNASIYKDNNVIPYKIIGRKLS